MRVDFVTALPLTWWIIRFDDLRQPGFDSNLENQLAAIEDIYYRAHQVLPNHRASGYHQNMGRDPDFCRCLGACRLY